MSVYPVYSGTPPLTAMLMPLESDRLFLGLIDSADTFDQRKFDIHIVFPDSHPAGDFLCA
jgi:hypothetical protein